MDGIPKIEFLTITELAETIHNETNGKCRKETIHTLKKWKKENSLAIFSPSEAAQRTALNEALEQAIKITESAFIPPWERMHH